MLKKNIGIVYIIISAFCFALMNLFVRMTGDGVPAIEKTFFRNFVALIVALGIMKKKHTSYKITGETLPGLLIRAGAGTVGMWCNYYALGKLDLADASMLNKLSPFFALLFSVIILKESLTVFQGGCVAMAFIGTMFIVKPGFFSMLGANSTAGLIGALGGMGAGLAYTYVRRLGEQNVPGEFVVFFFSLFSTAAAIPYSVLFGNLPDLRELVLLIMAGISAAGGQFSITAAYMHSPAREISIYDYTQIIFATLLGLIILNEVPDIYSFAGYAIIIGASLLLFFYNNGYFKRVS